MLCQRIEGKKAFLLLSASLLLQMPSLAQDGTAATGTGTAANTEPQTYAERIQAAEAAQAKKRADNAAAAAAQAKKNETQAATDESQDRKDAATGKSNTEKDLNTTSSVSTTNPPTRTNPNPAPIKLYGRIEELSAGVGAKIPLKMVAMQPIRDSSLDKPLSGKVQAQTLSGNAKVVQSFPVDYRGSWTGEVTINSNNTDPSYYEASPDEARQESQMLHAGTKGNYTVTFYTGANNHIQMQPSQITFQATKSLNDQLAIMRKQNPGAGNGGLGVFGGALGNMQMPVFLALKMGTQIAAGETSVTGNTMSYELMKNALKELSKTVLESDVVTRDRDRDPTTGKETNGFSESVLRFTRIGNNQLYVQGAHVYYRTDGKWQQKIMFYGTLDRGNGQQTAGYPNPANPFGGLMPGMGGGANPFGGILPGAGGAGSGSGNLQQQMQQMQDMIRKMGGQ